MNQILSEILNEYDNIISKGAYDIGNCTLVKHAIRIHIQNYMNVKTINYHQKKTNR